MTAQAEPFRPVTALVLAAGASRRMGQPKLLLPWDDGPLLAQTLRNVRGCSAESALVVTGAHAAAVAAVAAAHGMPHVHNPAYAHGEMVSSLQVGLQHTPAGHAVLVVLGDMPLLTPAVFDAVIAAYRAGLGTIVAPRYRGQRGHPVLFGPEHRAALLALPGGDAPRAVVQAHADALYLLDVDDPAVVADIDTPEQYRRARGGRG